MFKDNLVQLRKMLQMTQEEVADKLGVTRQSVAKWEAVIKEENSLSLAGMIAKLKKNIKSTSL